MTVVRQVDAGAGFLALCILRIIECGVGVAFVVARGPLGAPFLPLLVLCVNETIFGKPFGRAGFGLVVSDILGSVLAGPKWSI